MLDLPPRVGVACVRTHSRLFAGAKVDVRLGHVLHALSYVIGRHVGAVG